MKSITDKQVVLEVGERVVQAVVPFLIADGDAANGVRTGDFGHPRQTKIIFIRQWGARL